MSHQIQRAFSLENDTTKCEFLSLHTAICYLIQETACLRKFFNITVTTESGNFHITFSDELVEELTTVEGKATRTHKLVSGTV
jgi:hypothetical protein